MTLGNWKIAVCELDNHSSFVAGLLLRLEFNPKSRGSHAKLAESMDASRIRPGASRHIAHLFRSSFAFVLVVSELINLDDSLRDAQSKQVDVMNMNVNISST